MWHPSFRLGRLDDGWKEMPRHGGIYILRCSRSIPRAARLDRRGVLYGQASNLRNRLWSAWQARHSGTGIVWDYPRVTSAVLGSPKEARHVRDHHLNRLIVRFAGPIPERELDRYERALLFAYFYRHGELPPLNSTLPQRWARSKPGANLLRWARRGLGYSA